jgi:hypothetical protein
MPPCEGYSKSAGAFSLFAICLLLALVTQTALAQCGVGGCCSEPNLCSDHGLGAGPSLRDFRKGGDSNCLHRELLIPSKRRSKSAARIPTFTKN